MYNFCVLITHNSLVITSQYLLYLHSSEVEQKADLTKSEVIVFIQSMVVKWFRSFDPILASPFHSTDPFPLLGPPMHYWSIGLIRRDDGIFNQASLHSLLINRLINIQGGPSVCGVEVCNEIISLAGIA